MSREPQVVKSNHIINAAYRLSVVEQRVILACISKIPRNEAITDQHMYTVTAEEISQLSGTDINSAYRDLSEASKRLYDRSITILKDPDGENRPSRRRMTRWIQTVDYIESEGRVELRFGTDMIPFLNQLTEQFTRYALSDVAKMSSSYSIRLYEFFIQWKHTGKRQILAEIDQLRYLLDLENKYSAIKDLKRRVIDLAVAEINEHSPLTVSYEQKKTGRKITHLLFTIKFTSTAKKARQTATYSPPPVQKNSSLPRTPEEKEMALEAIKQMKLGLK